MTKEKIMMHRRADDELHDGFGDHLQPLEPLDLSKVSTINDMVVAMGNTAFSARSLSHAADILEKMTKENCYTVLTLSGAMTIAKMGLVVCDMIEKGMIDAIVSTGALMAHGFVEGTGKTHFKYDPSMDDTQLYEYGYNRVYDTLELEKNLDDAETIMDEILSSYPDGSELSSFQLHAAIGKYLKEKTEGRAILKSAYEKNIPVYVPAFTDSELGLDFAIHNKRRELAKRKPIIFNAFLDLDDYAERIKNQKNIGIFTIGGGVPRNWAQQVGPYLDITKKRIAEIRHRALPHDPANDPYFKRFKYAVRICPEPVELGGLSGCTYSEGVSWGKFVPREEGGDWAEVYSEATIAWPLIVKAVLERLEK
ncbi:MAG: deoxyhypusine synthase family protein [Nanoarchaeota archaeon]